MEKKKHNMKQKENVLCKLPFDIKSYLQIILLGIANIAKRERNKAAKQLDTLMKVS
jgi:hypothetical protein